jgi:hypothetical protein
MTDPVRKALEAACRTDGFYGSKPEADADIRRDRAEAIAAFLDALPNGLTLMHGDDWRADIDDEVMHALASAVRRAGEG